MEPQAQGTNPLEHRVSVLQNMLSQLDQADQQDQHTVAQAHVDHLTGAIGVLDQQDQAESTAKADALAMEQAKLQPVINAAAALNETSLALHQVASAVVTEIDQSKKDMGTFALGLSSSVETSMRGAADAITQTFAKPLAITGMLDLGDKLDTLNTSITSLPSLLKTKPVAPMNLDPVVNALMEVKTAVENVQTGPAKTIRWGGGAFGGNGPISFTGTTGPLHVSAADPLPVVMSGGGGGGVQYADGALRDTATGTLLMVDDGTNIQSASGDSAGRLNVNINGTVAVSGPLTDTQLRATAVPVSGTFFQATQPVSVASLPLPSGASTAANQTTANTSLSSIDGKIPALGQALAAASVPVVLTAAQLSTLTPSNVTNYSLETGGNLASIKTNTDKIPALGQALAAASVPVVLTAAQLTTLTPSNVTNYSLESGGNLATLAGIVTSSKAAVKIADGDDSTFGAKADAKSTATDTTAISAMSVLKQISASVQAPPSQAVTNAGTFAVQSTLQAGTAIIGKVTTDQTTHGTTDLVAADITKLAGTATAVNSGNTSAGTLRVVLATDQPALTNKLLVTPDANSSINISQIAAGTAITGGVTGSLATGGNVAHDGVNSGNPDYFGGEAIAFGTNPTAVAAGDRTKFYGTRSGIPFFLGGHPNSIVVEAAYTAAQTNTAIVTIATGLKIVVTACTVTVANANTVDAGVRVGFGTSTTPTTTGVILTHPGLAPGSGVIEGTGEAVIGVGADNEDLRITCDVPTSGSLRVKVVYHTIET